MPDKIIKDYLPFYLPFKMQWHEHKDFEIRGFEPIDDVSVRLFFQYGYVTEKWADIKIPLRPMASMTEGEAIEFVGLTELPEHYNDVKVSGSSFGDLIVSWQGMEEDRNEFNATGELFWCHEQFTWLLAKGFDIFDLIKAGLAIDKTKMETNGH